MTRFTKSSNGSYNVSGHNYEILSGSRAQVWHGTAFKTSGGLKKTDLMQNKAGRIELWQRRLWPFAPFGC